MGSQTGVTGTSAPHVTSGSCRKVRRACHEVTVSLYVKNVTAMPSDATPHRISLPRTIRAIKQALTAEQRDQFMAELEDIEAGGLRATVEKWWLTAVMNLSGTWGRVERVKNGTVQAVPIEDVIPDFAERFEQYHGQPYVGHASR